MKIYYVYALKDKKNPLAGEVIRNKDGDVVGKQSARIRVREFVGKVKAKNARKALEIAHEEHGDLPLDVIGKKYIVDRTLGTMRGPQKKQ